MTRKKSSSTRSSSRRRSTTQSRRRTTKKRGSGININLSAQQKALITGITFIFFTVVILLSLLSPNQGKLTETVSEWIGQLFGWGMVFVPLIIGALGFYLVLWGMEQPPDLPKLRIFGALLLVITLLAFFTLGVLTWSEDFADPTAIAKAGACHVPFQCCADTLHKIERCLC